MGLEYKHHGVIQPTHCEDSEAWVHTTKTFAQTYPTRRDQVKQIWLSKSKQMIDFPTDIYFFWLFENL
jgi:hypothetical protein